MPSGRVTRDMQREPPSPDQVRLRTGDRVRIEVRIDLPGFLTVFNVDPAGNLKTALDVPPGRFRPWQEKRVAHVPNRLNGC
jgi:hypothetical protein